MFMLFQYIESRPYNGYLYIATRITYPIEAKKGLPSGMSLVTLFYSEGLIRKLVGIVGLIKNS